MVMKMIPILETLQPGSSVRISGVKWGTLVVNNWNYVVEPGEVGMLLQQSASQPTSTTSVDNEDGQEIQIEVVVGESVYLFGDAETIQLTTDQGIAGGTITIQRHDGESRSLSDYYSLT